MTFYLRDVEMGGFYEASGIYDLVNNHYLPMREIRKKRNSRCLS